jgi:hypothetical protein
MGRGEDGMTIWEFFDKHEFLAWCAIFGLVLIVEAICVTIATCVKARKS